MTGSHLPTVLWRHIIIMKCNLFLRSFATIWWYGLCDKRHIQWVTYKLYTLFRPRVHKSSKNLGAASKFYVAETWQATSILWSHSAAVIREHQRKLALSTPCPWTDTHIGMSGRGAAIIMLKILGATEQNLVTGATRRLVFVHPWFWVLQSRLRATHIAVVHCAVRRDRLLSTVAGMVDENECS